MENNQQPQPNMQQQMDQMLQQQGQAQPVQPMQPMNGPAKKKKKKCNVPAIVLGVVAVLGVGAGVYFGMQYFGEKDRADRLAKQNTTVATTTETAETPSEGTAEVASSQVSYGFDSEKIVNKSDSDSLYTIRVEEVGVGGSLSEDGKTLALDFADETVRRTFGVAAPANGTKKIAFNQKVRNVYAGGIGQDAAGAIFLYVMEDGSLQYTSMNKMLTQNSYNVHGTVKGVTDVVTFYDAFSGSKTDKVGGGADVVVQDVKGNLYSVYRLLGDGFDNGV